MPILKNSCITNYMPNNQFKRGELYSVINGMASTAVARRLQKHFRQAGLDITIEQWSILYHLWLEDCLSQQELCNRTYRDKPSITRLIDNLEKQKLVKRIASKEDRRPLLARTQRTVSGRNRCSGRSVSSRVRSRKECPRIGSQR